MQSCETRFVETWIVRAMPYFASRTACYTTHRNAVFCLTNCMLYNTSQCRIVPYELHAIQHIARPKLFALLL